jgi:hypothetical protein
LWLSIHFEPYNDFHAASIMEHFASAWLQTGAFNLSELIVRHSVMYKKIQQYFADRDKPFRERFGGSRTNISRRKEIMEKLQEFQTAAREGGFVVVSESGEGTVLWLKKKVPDRVRDTHQHMCIDSLTDSVTIYWMAVPGKVKSQTFRGVAALQEWLEQIPEATMQR